VGPKTVEIIQGIAILQPWCKMNPRDR